VPSLLSRVFRGIVGNLTYPTNQSRSETRCQRREGLAEREGFD
jgi:hypothetical protein